MRLARQFLVILLFSFIGELLHAAVPLQIPASIYGLVLLFAALLLGIIKPGQVRESARFLIEIMPLMFIPAGVGLMESWGLLAPVFVPVCVITAVSTVLVMGISGRVTQAVIARRGVYPSSPGSAAYPSGSGRQGSPENWKEEALGSAGYPSGSGRQGSPENWEEEALGSAGYPSGSGRQGSPENWEEEALGEGGGARR